MDNNNWRPTQGGGEPAIDAGGDWRSQLQADSRQRIVNKIMDTLKRHLPFSGQEGLQELEKIAVRFEEKIYTAATNQSDYLRKISLKMLTKETENPMPNAMQSNSANNGQNSADPDLMDNNNWRPTQGGGEPAMDAGGDWRSQLQADSRQRIVNKMLLGAQSGTSVMPNNQHSVHMLQQSQESMSNQTQQMMSQIQSQSGQLQKQLGLQQQQYSLQQRLQTPGTLLQQQNVIDQQKQVFQPQRAMPEASSNSTAQTRNANGGDWQEEIYQKIKSMKDMYFLDLNDMFHKIAAKLHQIEPLLQQQPHLQQGKKLQLEKLKAFKRMLERFISLLQVSKSNIQIGYKDKLGSYEKQIMSILNSNRPRKPIPQMQQGQALPPPHMHSLQQTQTPQSQLTQLQPLENQMNLQMQSLNLQGYVGTMHQKTVGMLE